ncbi:uncharacterized protein LOC124805343 [Schistocerca piceifrons]|uniref:uncharacterized protein LOC124805343 n=1 Tax=Schistocerca piceifrons TaxID=274613 RepID=UPI001F5FD103|nr:uncharacterized protein LOC124805343 [Schistocerca piceifrons]
MVPPRGNRLRQTSPRNSGPVPELPEPDVISSPSPPSPPRISVPAVSSPVSTIFKDVKSPRKGRSFRKRREGSMSPSPPGAQPSSADVDLRGPPPDKVSRLSLSPKCVEPHVDAETKDVDLRPLTRGSPSKKRQSAERSEQPPLKRSKAEMIDVLFGSEELFGSEDVDLRTLAPIAVAPLAPSPPPPAAISRSSPSPPASTGAPPQSPTSPSAPAAATGKGYEHGVAGWAQLKEAHPDAYKSPATPVPSQSHNPTDRQAAQMNLFERPYDRLGRPLLYRKLQEQRAIIASGEDTDMRMLRMDSDIDLNINMIIAQAEEQLKSGNISFKEYNTLLKQVIHINEIQKLREAQRRDAQENKENWGANNVPVANVGTTVRRAHTASPLSTDDANRDSRGSPPCSSAGARFGDIDERFPGGTLPLPPPPVQWPAPQGAAMPRHPTWMEQPPWGARPPPTSTAPPVRHQPPPFRRAPDFPPPNFRWRQYGPGPGPGPGHGPRLPYDAQEDAHRFDRFPGNRFTRPPPPLPPQHQHSHPPQPSQQQQPLLPDPVSTSQAPATELPPADPLLLDLIAQDSMRTINIDRIPREIRFYGDTAVVLLAWDDPREISFQGGVRRVTFDDRESVICAFNEPYRDFTLDGQTHRIRLGAPTRELYIDGKWYECFFGGPPVNIDIGGKIRSVKLDGPPPHVKIGFVKRTDLVAGKINLIIDARTMVPVFLDAKPQRFDVENKPHVLRFVDKLKTVLLNGRPFEVEFGGLPKPIVARGRKHFVRFSVLPQGVRPGYVNIVNMDTMEDRRLPSPETGSVGGDAEPSRQSLPVRSDGHSPVLPMLGASSRRKVEREQGRDSPESSGARNSPTVGITTTVDNSAVTSFGTVPALTAQRPTPGQLPLEMLTSLIPASMAPAAASGVGYCVEQQDSSTTQPQQQSQSQQQQQQQQQTTSSSTLSLLPGLGEVNVEELFRKLVATGIVPAGQSTSGTGVAEEKKTADDPATQIKPVDFSQPETLRVRQPALVAQLYSGIQCSSCGVRFPPEHTMKYSQHLDWHFRQNRRERDSTRKAQSRKWYYDVSDWIQFEEIEDLEERAQSWFETQQAGAAGTSEESSNEIPSVSAEGQEDAVCDVCHDHFEQFYNEEREEWHLRMAIRVDGHVYHPLCYEDLKASEAAAAEEASSIAEDAENQESTSNLDEQPVKEPDQVDGEENKKMEEEISAEKTECTDEAKTTSENEQPDEKETIKAEVKDEASENDLAEDVKKLNVKEEPMESTEAEAEQTEETAEPKVKTENDDTEGMNEDMGPQTPPPLLLPSVVDTTLAAVACTIDGNVQFEDAPTQPPALSTGRIKINIGKMPAPAIVPAVAESDGDTSAEEPHSPLPTRPLSTDITAQAESVTVPVMTCETFQPPPPGVEPVSLKPRLVGLKMTELPPVTRGTELSGLCSIM